MEPPKEAHTTTPTWTRAIYPSPETQPPKFSKVRLFLVLAFMLFVVCITTVLVLSTTDTLTIPYITPFALFIAKILSPLLPLIAPFFLGIFLKLVQHEKFEGRVNWIAISLSWIFNQVQRVCQNFAAVWGINDHDGIIPPFLVEFMGMQMKDVNWHVLCDARVLEEVLIVLVMLAQWRGWRWEAGLLDKWIEGLVVQGEKQKKIKEEKKAKKEAEKAAKEAESQAKDMENGEVVEQLVDVSVEEEQDEKTALLVNV